ncbi:hypothetical protein FA09DRAFT_345049 [Tilletiopsis washingtonensis]|uniref:ER membrane protein complex subunit 6 n=1 Tax=Tilletiopsis washingtonensis TaxID=58919 RepID=A0A316ZGJ8_9BASI|nr:hypothetical protein FA09DRAFT_345049 [Tilletiopsis washingtonensis]PWO00377.1 hypothetical protein FA09DRAFT_345049 [Tilletiopsis washingtonensis]
MDSTPTAAQLSAAQLSPAALAHNNGVLFRIRAILLLLSGSLCGILGLRAIPGGLFFLASLLLVNALLLLFAGGPLKAPRYLPSWREGLLGKVTYFAEGASEFAPGYVLAWTMAGAIVHGESRLVRPAVGKGGGRSSSL